MTVPGLPEELASARSVLVLAPHPDDEILGCGYLMQAFTAAGTALEVVWLTDGGAARGIIPDWDRKALVARRQREALAGLRSMAIDCATEFFGRPDGALAQARHRLGAAARLRAIIDERGVDMLFVTDGDDSHPDHRAAFALAQHMPVPALYSYPVSGRYDGKPADRKRPAIALGGDGAAKRSALACHASQSAAGGAVYPMSEAAIDRFCTAPEIFYPVAETSP